MMPHLFILPSLVGIILLGLLVLVKDMICIQGMIRDAVEDAITWPVRKIIPILPGDYR